jgi:hypothetical protein
VRKHFPPSCLGGPRRCALGEARNDDLAVGLDDDRFGTVVVRAANAEILGEDAFGAEGESSTPAVGAMRGSSASTRASIGLADWQGSPNTRRRGA